MAAALFGVHAERHETKLDVASAGIAALVGCRPPETVIDLMARRGCNLSAHRAQQFTLALASRYDLVLVMETAQQRFIEQNWITLRGRVRRLGEWRGEDVPDPYRMPREYYAKCLALIEACVGDWEERLLP